MARVGREFWMSSCPTIMQGEPLRASCPDPRKRLNHSSKTAEKVYRRNRGKDLLNFIAHELQFLLQKFYSEIFGRMEVIGTVLSKSEFDFIALVST